MATSWTKRLSLGLILIAGIVGLILAPQLPDQMASHRNAAGNVDGRMSKFRGIALLPLLILGIRLLLTYLPRLDPLKPGASAYGKRYQGFILIIIVFFAYVYLLTLLRNLGRSFQLGSAMIPALALLCIYIGTMMKHTARNRFVGIRTPRTLSSDHIRKKTHRLWGTLFQGAGVCCLLGILFPLYSLRFILLPLAGAALISVIYSYFLFKKHTK